MTEIVIRTPDTLDLSTQRIQINDTTAFIDKFTATQIALESFSGDLNNYADDIQQVADIAVQAAQSVNLPAPSGQPGYWLRSQANGSYALEQIQHSDISGLSDHYLAKSGGDVASLTIAGKPALTTANIDVSALSVDGVTYDFNGDGTINTITETIGADVKTITCAYNSGDLTSVTVDYQGVVTAHTVLRDVDGIVTGIDCDDGSQSLVLQMLTYQQLQRLDNLVSLDAASLDSRALDVYLWLSAEVRTSGDVAAYFDVPYHSDNLSLLLLNDQRLIDVVNDSNANANVMVNPEIQARFLESPRAIGKLVAQRAGLLAADYADIYRVLESTTAMTAVAASPAAMQLFVSSDIAMQSLLEQPAAVDLVVANLAAMTAIVADSNAVTLLMNDSAAAVKAVATQANRDLLTESLTAMTVISNSAVVAEMASDPLRLRDLLASPHVLDTVWQSQVALQALLNANILPYGASLLAYIDWAGIAAVRAWVFSPLDSSASDVCLGVRDAGNLHYVVKADYVGPGYQEYVFDSPSFVLGGDPYFIFYHDSQTSDGFMSVSTNVPEGYTGYSLELHKYSQSDPARVENDGSWLWGLQLIKEGA